MGLQFIRGLLLFFGSLAISAAFLAAIPASHRPRPEPDYRNHYAPVASNLLAGKGLLENNGSPAMTYPPGQSLFLIGSFFLADRLGVNRDAMAIAFGMVLYAATVVIAGYWAARVWTGWRAGAATFLWAIYPLGLWLAPLCGSEVPYVFFLLGGALLFWIGGCEEQIACGPLFLSGICVGAAMITRPIAMPVPLILAAILLGFSRKQPWQLTARALGSFLLAVAVMVVPWEAWMYAQSGKVLPLSANGPSTIFAGLVFGKQTNPDQAPIAMPADVDAMMTDMLTKRRNGEVERAGAAELGHDQGQQPALSAPARRPVPPG